ncbi:hypothetical protein [uncultured Phenylobacterium sp.]|uniref:hypothetical protein n=1 Tax=uncultured Phenylobacterium sp. TaxID=349273 RepID=UPI0025F81A9F|nr:hypothetical protein [uncultured Phenylobacterium sp.]
MAANKPKTDDETDVVTRLMDGHYDRLLADFEAQLEEATAALRRCHAAMRAENTLVS